MQIRQLTEKFNNLMSVVVNLETERDLLRCENASLKTELALHRDTITNLASAKHNLVTELELA